MNEYEVILREIDIQVRNEDLFSIDVLVTGSYTKTSLVSPAYSQSNQTI